MKVTQIITAVLVAVFVNLIAMFIYDKLTKK